MLLPEIVHLPAVLLLALVVVSGTAVVTVIPFVAALLRVADGQWLSAVGAVIGTLLLNAAAWFGFRTALRGEASSRFLGFSSRLWLIGVSLAYLTGVGFGIYLCFLFYL